MTTQKLCTQGGVLDENDWRRHCQTWTWKSWTLHHLSFIFEKAGVQIETVVIPFEIVRIPFEITTNQFEKDASPFENVIIQNEKDGIQFETFFLL